MPAIDATDLANAALAMSAVDAIASLDEDSTQARLINHNYQHVVENELSLFPWPFNRKNKQLSRLADEPTDTSWDAAYQLPADHLDLRAVELNGCAIRYHRVGNTIECNAGDSDTVIATYGYRSDEATWPAYFRQLVILRLAVIVSSGLTEQPGRARNLQLEAQEQLMRARHAGSVEDTNEHLPLGARINAARRSFRAT